MRGSGATQRLSQAIRGARLPTQPTPISVLIPVRNEGIRLLRTVESLAAGRSQPFPLEIVITDDASSDGACEQLARLSVQWPDVSIVSRRLERWSGIPFARNRCADFARHPTYLITDANTRYPSNWDLAIWRHFDRRRVHAATIVDLASSFRGFGCHLLLPSMGVRWLAQPGIFGGYVPVSPCTCTVIDRALFHHLGGYDESLPVYGAAEPEFSVRAWLSGYEIVNLPDLLVGHRFRPRKQHDRFLESISPTLRRNYLRFACYYLPEELLRDTYEHYASQAPEDFRACMAELEAGGVWNRRARLQQGLLRDFRWLMNRFSLGVPDHHADRNRRHLG